MKLSVIVLAGSAAHSVKRCLDGFAAQPEHVAELLVALPGNDASEWRDDTSHWPFPVEIVELPPETTGNPAAVRNAALARTRNELVLFTDAQSLPAPGVVAGHVAAQIRSGGTRTIVGRRTALASNPLTPLQKTLEDSRDARLFDRNPRGGDAGWPAFHAGHLSAPRVVLQQNPFDERFQSDRFSDLELGYRLARTGHRIEYRNDLVVWRDDPLDLPAMRDRYRRYGAEIALLHELHPEERLAIELGVSEARGAEHFMAEAVETAEAAIPKLEAALGGFDLRSPNTRRCFGAAQSERMLAECYSTLAHFELVSGLRAALGLQPLATKAAHAE